MLREYRDFRGAVDDLIGEDAIAWWVTRAVDRLADEPVESVPSWFCDPTLPGRMIDHWRNVPLPGLWEPVTASGGFRGRRPLSGVFAELAPILEGLAAHNIGPREADTMEIWEIGAILGLHDPDREMRHQRESRTGSTNADRMGMPTPRRGSPNAPSQSEINRARVEAARAGSAAPQWQREHADPGAEMALINGLR